LVKNKKERVNMKFFKKARKVTALSMALVMFALVACGDGNGDAVDATTTPTPAAGGQTQTDDVGLTAGGGGDLDLGGRNVRLLSWWVYGLTDTDADEPTPDTAYNYLVARMMWDNRERVQRDFNVNLSSIAVGWHDMMPTLTSSVMAGDPVADMSVLFGWMTFSAIMGGLIMPVSAYTTVDSDVVSLQRFLRPGAVMDGEIWSVVENTPALGDALGVNLDIINALGLENPADLHDRGAWNWTIWREMMIEATRDTSGDGVVDQFGFIGPGTDLMLNLISVNDGPMVDNGQYAFNHPHTLRALEFLFDMVQTDGTFPTEVYSGDWIEGNAAFFNLASWRAGEIEFDFTIVPYPPGPDNQRGYTHYTGFPQGIAIPVGVENPHDVHRIHEELRAWPGDRYYLLSDGVWEGLRSSLQRESDVVRWIEDIGPNARMDLARTINEYYWIAGWFMDNFTANTHTVAMAVEDFRPHFQNILDMAFGVTGG
jgi:multiple sugar transport system substrate-binding protein